MQQEAWTLIGWHADFKNLGVLPFGGSDLMQEPAWLYEAFQKITAVKNAAGEAEAREWRDKAKSES